VPYYGGLISIVVFFALLKKLMDIDLLKAIVICGMAFFLRWGAALGIAKLLAVGENL
jgi:hypothetical protein